MLIKPFLSIKAMLLFLLNSFFRVRGQPTKFNRASSPKKVYIEQERNPGLLGQQPFLQTAYSPFSQICLGAKEYYYLY